MKREELKALGLTDEQIEKVMGLHGTTVTDLQNKLSTASKDAEDRKGQLDKLTTDLADAQKNTGDVAALKDQLAKAQAALASTQKSQKVRDALGQYKPHDAETLMRLLDLDKVNITDAGIVGLKEQVEPLKETKKFLFADSADPAGGKDPANPNPPPATTVEDAIKGIMFPHKDK